MCKVCSRTKFMKVLLMLGMTLFSWNDIHGTALMNNYIRALFKLRKALQNRYLIRVDNLYVKTQFLKLMTFE